MQIGIDQSSGLIFEGSAPYGRVLSPAPFLSPCKICMPGDSALNGPDTTNISMGMVFREDYFDPVSRIRRGRIYKAGNSNPRDWFNGNETIYANTYHGHSIFNKVRESGKGAILLLMGDKERFTTWKLVDIEVISTTEELITIKSIGTMGLLPDLISDLPENHRKELSPALDKVRDEAYKSNPESVIDLCRDAAVRALGIFLGNHELDLGRLISALNAGDSKKRIATNCAAIIKDFHARRKPNEQNKHGLRAPMEEDAVLSVQCLGLLLVELNLARY